MSTVDENTAKMLELVDRYPDTGGGADSKDSADERDQQPDTGAAYATMRELLNRYDELRWTVSELRDSVERLRDDVNELQRDVGRLMR
jgi:predicted RNase H-like nuclease (RuvC/YqgF family)